MLEKIFADKFFIGYFVFCGVILFAIRKKKDKQDIANFALSLGALGTFLGITWGLINFDENDISGSIPMLLGGLKTAFFTSISGMFISFIIKAWGNSNKDKKSSEDKAVEIIQKSLEPVISSLEKIEKANLGQNKSLETFTDTLVKQNQSALTDYTKHLITSINEGIEKELGNSFKELNSSIENLNKWQEENKEQVEFFAEKFSVFIKHVKLVDKYLSTLTEKGEIFDKYVENGSEIIESMNTSKQDLSEIMKAVTTFSNESKKTIENLEESIVKLNTGMKESVEKSLEESWAHLDDQKHQFSEINKNLHKSLNDISDHIEDIFVEGLADIQKKTKASINIIGDSMASMSEKIRDDHLEILEANKKINEITSSAVN